MQITENLQTLLSRKFHFVLLSTVVVMTIQAIVTVGKITQSFRAQPLNKFKNVFEIVQIVLLGLRFM
jgi:hypothetical protein